MSMLLRPVNAIAMVASRYQVILVEVQCDTNSSTVLRFWTEQY